jgi:hypothetical protein
MKAGLPMRSALAVSLRFTPLELEERSFFLPTRFSLFEQKDV